MSGSGSVAFSCETVEVRYARRAVSVVIVVVGGILQVAAVLRVCRGWMAAARSCEIRGAGTDSWCGCGGRRQEKKARVQRQDCIRKRYGDSIVRGRSFASAGCLTKIRNGRLRNCMAMVRNAGRGGCGRWLAR